MVDQIIGQTVTVQPVNTSLTVEMQTYLGNNQIRRNLGGTVSAYFAGTVKDNYTLLSPSGASTELFPSPTKLIVLNVNGPVTVTVVVNAVSLVLPVTKTLVLDTPVSSITMLNSGATDVQAHLAYAF